MYDASDPRAGLHDNPSRGSASAPAGADYLKFYALSPDTAETGAESWYARGQNFIVAYSIVEPGAVLDRHGQPDEYALILPDRDTHVSITTAGEHAEVSGDSLTFVPPGDSSLRVVRGGTLIRVFSHKATDLAAICSNAASYLEAQPNTAPLTAWPTPEDGFRIRSYGLDVPPEPGRFGRIFRSTNLMISFVDPWDGPRDATKLSPHHHDDFQQGSLAIHGKFVHHLRWPWGSDSTQWRGDDHVYCESPSLAIIPPPSIHTTEAVGEGRNQLIDIFSPPRADFSSKDGWVLNAADYPMPAALR